MNIKDYTGQRFGKLVVVALHERVKHQRTKWLCKCDCGNSKVITNANLKNGGTKSCGCLFKEFVSKPSRKVYSDSLPKFLNTGISLKQYRTIHGSESKMGHPSPRRKPIVQFDAKFGFIAEFDSITQAASHLKILVSSIANNLGGRTKICAGFIFQYKK